MKIKLTATQYRAIDGNRRRNGDNHARHHAREIALILATRTKRDFRKDTREQRLNREYNMTRERETDGD